MLQVGIAAGLATDPLFALQVLALAAAMIFAFDLALFVNGCGRRARCPARPSSSDSH